MLDVVAALLIVAGVVVVATTPAESFGWFAYAPLSDEVYEPPSGPELPVVLSGRHLLGLGAVVTGLVLASLAIGIRLGQRQAR